MENENNFDEKKEIIINFIKQNKKVSISRFIGVLGSNYELVKKILDEMESEGVIIKIEETLATYYSLKDGI